MRAAPGGIRVARGYRRLLVPLDVRPESFDAFRIACRLAADEHARITALAVIEVPALLPLDAHLDDAEDSARRRLEQAGATGDAHGVRVTTRLVRDRDVAAAIVAHAISDRSELIVVAAPRSTLAASPRRLAPDPVVRVLKGAPCRVMVVSAPSREAA
jgi:K+-sensing histidine kinase KdpD